MSQGPVRVVFGISTEQLRDGIRHWKALLDYSGAEREYQVAVGPADLRPAEWAAPRYHKRVTDLRDLMYTRKDLIQ